jgi:hypothetical protein
LSLLQEEIGSLKAEIEKTGKPYAIITGRGELRIENAINAVKKYIETR